MKKIILLLSLWVCYHKVLASWPETCIWYDKPAENWEKEALPMGNGRIGAMIFGKTDQEIISLNEISFWSGGNNPSDGYNYGSNSDKDEFGAFLPFGDFLITYNHSEISQYRRVLDLDRAIMTVDYYHKDVKYHREYFISHPDQALVMTCRASKSKALDAIFSFVVNEDYSPKTVAFKKHLIVSGKLKNGLEYEGRAYLGKTDGKLLVKNKQLVLTDATYFTVYILLATDYEMNFTKKWKGEKPQKKNQRTLSNLLRQKETQLFARHLKDYQALFQRVKIDLGKSSEEVKKYPFDQRLISYKKSPKDAELEALLFQYGRYCLIASSRSGNLPANLQGIWNNNPKPAWASDYHSNINLQMCYWLAEPANLAECVEPFIDYFKAMVVPFSLATKRKFGQQARGWTTGISHNPFGGIGWKWNMLASAWYARHIWEHYLYSGNKKYLKEQAYPMLKDICHWVESYLKELGPDGEGFYSSEKLINKMELKGLKAGTLVVPKGWSHEWGPTEDGVSHDQQLVWDLFNNTIKAAKILQIDQEWIKQLEEKKQCLAPLKISPQGYLQEWMIDRPNLVTGHRHTSHLFAVYPGNQINLQTNPELVKAAKKSLELRGTDGDSRRSWTWPWRTALWARFLESEKAHKMIEGYITYNLMPNLLATHPPFQMDGTYGITAGICEMLMQCHTGKIILLPALPKEWENGKVSGLRAYGDVLVDFTWKNGQVTNYSFYAKTEHEIAVFINKKEYRVLTKQKQGKK